LRILALDYLWNKSKEIKVPFELRLDTISFYENIIDKFRNPKGWWKKLIVIEDSSKGVPYPQLFLVYISKS
jgi:hypothetical protein